MNIKNNTGCVLVSWTNKDDPEKMVVLIGIKNLKQDVTIINSFFLEKTQRTFTINCLRRQKPMNDDFKNSLIEIIDDVTEALKKDIRLLNIDHIKDFSIEIHVMEDGVIVPPVSILYNISNYSESYYDQWKKKIFENMERDNG